MLPVPCGAVPAGAGVGAARGGALRAAAVRGRRGRARRLLHAPRVRREYTPHHHVTSLHIAMTLVGTDYPSSHFS